MSPHQRLDRRRFLQSLAVAGGAVATTGLVPALGFADPPAKTPAIRVGSCLIELPQAKEAGLDGAEPRLLNLHGDDITLADPAVRQAYKEQMRATGLPIPSLSLNFFNSYPLAADPRAPKWLEQVIEAAHDLGARTALVAFFRHGDLLDQGKVKEEAVDVVVQRLKAVAPLAEKAGVTLALENLLTAEQNRAILERIGSEAVRVYYDIGNLTGQGYDVVAGIRLLKDRIVQFHFKDGPNYLGEGKIDYPAVAAAIRDIGYQGWIVLEGASPSGDPVADARRNAAFIRKLFGVG